MMGLFLINMQFFTSPDVKWWTGAVWITCGLLWCFYQLFGLSFWRHPFTAEDPLLSKRCNVNFSKPVQMNKLIYILDDLRVNTFSANFECCVNYSFMVKYESAELQCGLFSKESYYVIFLIFWFSLKLKRSVKSPDPIMRRTEAWVYKSGVYWDSAGRQKNVGVW